MQQGTSTDSVPNKKKYSRRIQHARLLPSRHNVLPPPNNNQQYTAHEIVAFLCPYDNCDISKHCHRLIMRLLDSGKVVGSCATVYRMLQKFRGGFPSIPLKMRPKEGRPRLIEYNEIKKVNKYMQKMMALLSKKKT